MYSRAFFIRAIARRNYPRVYSRHYNDLRVLSTSQLQRFRAVHDSEVNGAHGPYWKRVAISRHEFHRQSDVAQSTSCFASGTGSPSAGFSSSQEATMGSVVASTTPVQRPMRGAPFHACSATVASSVRISRSAVVSPTGTACRRLSTLLPSQTIARVNPYMCLVEAV